MVCPKCGTDKVIISTEQVSAKTNRRGKGCLWSVGRLLLICCTGGLWLLVGKHKGKASTKFKHKTVAICQSCGNKWDI